MQINYDSEFCGRLPIHLTNQIQPYGALLVIDADAMTIVQVSENIADVLSRSVNEVINAKLADYVDNASISDMVTKFGAERNDQIPATWSIGGRQHLVLIHRKENYLLVEIDMASPSSGETDTFVEVYQELKYAMSSIEQSTTLQETCGVAARELKRISGFDKVMIYRFDPEWNGMVIAEAGEAAMEAYMGLTFPASDIPRQARQLYLRNPYRYIPDREYKPVSLYPVVNPLTSAFTDLSDCNLRSVASVHLEYLKNMGVTASMSTRILHHDQLWGLIACHHRTARHIDFKMCSVFEMFSAIISMKITSLQNQSRLYLENQLTGNYASLVESVYKGDDLDSVLLAHKGLLELFSATGVAVSRAGSISVAGTTPDRDQLDELLLWLHTRQLKKVYHTSSLAAENEYAKEYQDIASGLLVIPINSMRDQYVILFRPEKIRIINWGGNPDERIQFEPGEKAYHPRNSFRQWQQKVSGVSLPWDSQELKLAETLRSFIFEYETSAIL